MAFGERIRTFRKAIGMTQKELGRRLGFSERTAVIRVGQYENEKRTPKKDMIDYLAYIFDVAPEAITVPNIDNYYGLMHTLFTLEDCYGLTIAEIDGQVCLTMNRNHPNYDAHLDGRLYDWIDVKRRLNNGSMLLSEYDHWRHSYPADKAAEQKRERDEYREARKEAEKHRNNPEDN